ncbi:flagellar protein FlaG protein [Psychromonas sp. CNPT3]|uniref:flagellar protein FlaG n=1 Tax=Psychromonas sp. CNPT3 TaxID=314282 RepID=UPI0002C0E7C5|nr:flagellar protein FlaG [Psychromonas sp. CNPT3]AGH82012.1 flagellar protein FlaG protein [Psychromonas sp. CNPT3]
MSDFTISSSPINRQANETSKERDVEKIDTKDQIKEDKALDSMSAKSDPKDLKLGIDNIEETVAEINDFMSSMQSHLSFHIDKELEQVIISVIDGETDEVIRQIPSEDLVILLKKMDGVKGMLFDTKV